MRIRRELRVRAGLTQDEVAKKLGIGRTTVAMWESGGALPRAATLAKLAAMYHCTMEELLEERQGA